MITLSNSLSAWQQPQFRSVLTQELLQLDNETFPLYKATNFGGFIKPEQLDLVILSTTENNDDLLIKTGIFFTELIGGCNCHDDPTEENIYCEALITINKTNAQSQIRLIKE